MPKSASSARTGPWTSHIKAAAYRFIHRDLGQNEYFRQLLSDISSCKELAHERQRALILIGNANSVNYAAFDLLLPFDNKVVEIIIR